MCLVESMRNICVNIKKCFITIGVDNSIKLLTIDEDKLNWKILKSKGVAPKPRYMHTFDYWSSLNSLVLYGGRQERISEQSDTFFFNDLWLYQISISEWTEVTLLPSASSWYSHVSAISNTKLMIFGGLNGKTLWKPDTFIIDFSNETAGHEKVNFKDLARLKIPK